MSICREEPVCLKCSEGLVTVNVGARPSVLRGEPVSENSKEEPVCLRCNEGLVTVGARSSMLRGEPVSENSREEPVCLRCNEGLVTVNVGARVAVALVAFKRIGDIA